MNETYVAELMVKSALGQCTPEEQQLLEEFKARSQKDRDFVYENATIEAMMELKKQGKSLDDKHIRSKLIAFKGRKGGRFLSMGAWLAAASVAGLLFVLGSHWFHHSVGELGMDAKTNAVRNDVLPGRNKAVLTLSNGSSLILDSVQNGTIARQGAMAVVKVDNGLLAYNAAAHTKTAEPEYNTLTTPAAGQYQLVLPDGSKVWLNNASSLRYPVAFAGKTREVELQGEGYFEIAPDKDKPFTVKVGSQQVAVLGTSFNISSYTDEAVTRTTLVEGAVRVSEKDRSVVLQPGQQAQVNTGDATEAGVKVIDANVRSVIAWKKGFFNFDHADVETVMRQFARWYDVRVEYPKGAITNRTFYGLVSRDLKLSDALNILNSQHIHCTLLDNKIIVTP